MTARKRKALPELRAVWSKRERDIVFHWDKHPPDGHLMHYHITPLLDELKRRGFDITTAKFSIRRARVKP